MAAGDPVAPDTETRGTYGVSVDDVAGLCPGTRIVEPGASEDDGHSPITVDRVTSWINDVTAEVNLRTASAARITDITRSDLIRAACTTLVKNGAASYLEAAKYPERASKADTSYAEVLWQRYQTGLAALVTQIDTWLEDGAPVDPGTGGGLLAASFPPPRFPDCMEF